jgi:hypothetical protein
LSYLSIRMFRHLDKLCSHWIQYQGRKGRDVVAGKKVPAGLRPFGKKRQVSRRR